MRIKYEVSGSVKVAELIRVAKVALATASNDDARPVLECALLAVNANGDATIVSTDSHVLSVQEMAGWSGETSGVLIPRDVLTWISKLKAATMDTVSVTYDGEASAWQCAVGFTSSTFGTADGQFPAWSQIMPAKPYAVADVEPHTFAWGHVVLAALLKIQEAQKEPGRKGSGPSWPPAILECQHDRLKPAVWTVGLVTLLAMPVKVPALKA